MASYHIIGGDTKEYGPVSGEDIRLWISEGRLNAQSLAKGEGDTTWRTLGSFPEFNTTAQTAPAIIAPLKTSVYAAPVSTDFQERDYELDIGGCITGGWELLKRHFATLFLGFLVANAIIFVVSMIIGTLVSAFMPTHAMVLREACHLFIAALMAPVAGPLMGGLYFLFIRLNRNEPAEVGHVFIGFQKNFQPLFLGYLLIALISGICLAPYNMISDAKLTPIFEQLQKVQPGDMQAVLQQLLSALADSAPLLLVCMIPLTYLTVSLQFALPLIVDKQMAFWPAMTASWKMVHKHWLSVFGLTIVVGLVTAAGILACGVGLLFTIPLGVSATMIGYETIFGARKN